MHRGGLWEQKAVSFRDGRGGITDKTVCADNAKSLVTALEAAKTGSCKKRHYGISRGGNDIEPLLTRLGKPALFLSVALAVLFVSSCEYVFNQAPVVSIIGGDRSAVGGQRVVFEADAYDPEAGSLSYYWYLDDERQQQAPGSTFAITLSPESVVSYQVTVQASDGIAMVQDSVLLTVSPNHAPTVQITGSDVAMAGEIVTFEATAADADGDDISFAWSVDGQDQEKTGSTFSYSATPFETRDFEIAVAATDEPGATTTASVTLTVTVLSSADTGDYYYDYVSQTGDFTYTLDTSAIEMGDGTKNVYFVFTNSASTQSEGIPLVEMAASEFGSRGLSGASPDVGAAADDHDFGVRGVPAQTNNGPLPPDPAITEFNRFAHTFIEELPAAVARRGLELVPRSIGDTETFSRPKVGSSPGTVAATLRGLVTGVETEWGYRNLEIWVADNVWVSGGERANLVTQEMVDAIASAFLTSGFENDIYDYITGIFGPAWGPRDTTDNLISEDVNTISVLLMDIEEDNSTNGGIVGLYYSRDNFIAASRAASNERLMFYLDAVMYAEADGAAWDLHDYWPAVGISTLTHEFQHMIHFYQKSALRQTSSETWLNEMVSMVAEDLVALPVGVDGPRGVAHDDGTAGDAANTSGRLPLFNYYNNDSLTTWSTESSDKTLRSYAVAYAYGAWLARNFGGAALMRAIVQSPYGGTDAVSESLATLGYGYKFIDTLRMWGTAVLLSDVATPSPPVRYNADGWIEADVSEHEYSLGSINLYNYLFKPNAVTPAYDGPWINKDKTSYNNDLPGHSSTFYLAGTVATGETASWDIELPDDVLMTVVVKE